jgi:hypothetical protein
VCKNGLRPNDVCIDFVCVENEEQTVSHVFGMCEMTRIRKKCETVEIDIEMTNK